MQKTKFNKYILFTFVAVVFTSCIKNEKIEVIKYGGNTSNESRHINDEFDKINVSGNINVIIEQSDDTRVTVITNKGFHNEIKTEVKNGTLYISTITNKTSFSIFGYKHSTTKEAATKKVIVKITRITELETSDASKIESKGVLKGNAITLKSSSASEMKLELEFEKIDSESSSASKIELKGMALELNANTSSASKIEAEDLLVNSITAQSSSGSQISVHPIVSLNADASSGSLIEYNNNPKQIEKTSSSGGSINQNSD